MVPRLGGVCGRVMVITMLCSALVRAETTNGQVRISRARGDLTRLP